MFANTAAGIVFGLTRLSLDHDAVTVLPGLLTPAQHAEAISDARIDTIRTNYEIGLLFTAVREFKYSGRTRTNSTLTKNHFSTAFENCVTQRGQQGAT